MGVDIHCDPGRNPGFMKSCRKGELNYDKSCNTLCIGNLFSKTGRP